MFSRWEEAEENKAAGEVHGKAGSLFLFPIWP